MLMPMETLQTILRELHKHDYKGEIHPYAFGEPLTDPRLFAILELIQQWFPGNRVRVNTNGDFVTDEKLEKMLERGVDLICVNHYDDKELTQAIDMTYPQVWHYGLKGLLPGFFNRAGTVDIENKKERQFRCLLFLHKLSFNYKGEMNLCCADFYDEVVFGDINRQSLEEILSSHSYRKYYSYHKDGWGEQLPVCSRCDLI